MRAFRSVSVKVMGVSGLMVSLAASGCGNVDDVEPPPTERTTSAFTDSNGWASGVGTITSEWYQCGSAADEQWLIIGAFGIQHNYAYGIPDLPPPPFPWNVSTMNFWPGRDIAFNGRSEWWAPHVAYLECPSTIPMQETGSGSFSSGIMYGAASCSLARYAFIGSFAYRVAVAVNANFAYWSAGRWSVNDQVANPNGRLFVDLSRAEGFRAHTGWCGNASHEFSLWGLQ